jgi:hypothetical protein
MKIKRILAADYTVFSTKTTKLCRVDSLLVSTDIRANCQIMAFNWQGISNGKALTFGRSTRKTERFKTTGGQRQGGSSWIGNSPEVAMKHYAQVIEADMNKAAQMSILNDTEKTVQNPVQHYG